jgi:hypothetical protein
MYHNEVSLLATESRQSKAATVRAEAKNQFVPQTEI